ncbi:MAG: hypothetical protein ACRDKW_02065, partial [Actinomycetota bacterium]
MKTWGAWGTPGRPEGGPRRSSIVAIIASVVFLASYLAGASSGRSLIRDVMGEPPQEVDPADRPQDQAALLEQIRIQVGAIRELGWKKKPSIHILPREAFAERLRAARASDEPEPAVSDGAILELLGLIPQGTDYDAVEEQLSDAQVAGFYDTETKEIVVPQGSGPVGARSLMTLAHELEHALVDQHFRFGERFDELAEQDRDEDAAALRALVEGDARLVEYAWADRHLTSEEVLTAMLGGDDDEGRPSIPDDVPSFLLEASAFPYKAGRDFVRHLHRAGGFVAVDQAFREPPRSTSEILHPELYPLPAEPEAVPLPDPAPAGCRTERSGVLGEWEMREVLEVQPSATAAAAAVAGWRGDAFGMVRCGSKLGMVQRWRAADEAAATRFAEAAVLWA